MQAQVIQVTQETLTSPTEYQVAWQVSDVHVQTCRGVWGQTFLLHILMCFRYV